MSELGKPPQFRITSQTPQELAGDLNELNEWLEKIYNLLKNKNFSSLAISTGTDAPSGGQDGDMYRRKDGANTALYINVNGVWNSL